MNTTPGDSIEAVRRHIRPVLESDKRVCFAYLFGSVAQGTARPGSDIYIAVLTRPRGTLLDDAPLWLRYRVVAGEVVFSRDERCRIAFREWTDKEFLDFRPYHDSYLRAIRDRAQRGALSGG